MKTASFLPPSQWEKDTPVSVERVLGLARISLINPHVSLWGGDGASLSCSLLGAARRNRPKPKQTKSRGSPSSPRASLRLFVPVSQTPTCVFWRNDGCWVQMLQRSNQSLHFGSWNSNNTWDGSFLYTCTPHQCNWLLHFKSNMHLVCRNVCCLLFVQLFASPDDGLCREPPCRLET